MVAKTIKEPRPKRTKAKAVAEAAPAPTPDSLALIAANVAKGVDLEPRLAVDYALKLWQCAREKLAGEIKEPAPVPEEPKIEKTDVADPAPVLPPEPPPVSQPPRDTQLESPPATPTVPPPKTALPTFDTFLRTVVKGETVEDSEEKFRTYLRSRFPESNADEQTASLKKDGFKDVNTWLKTSRDYRDWDKSEKTN